MSEYINRDSLLERMRKELSEIELKEFEATRNGDCVTQMGANTMYRAYYKALKDVMEEPVFCSEEKLEKTRMGRWLMLYGSYDNTPSELVFCCSECKHRIVIYGNDKPWDKYCSSCGAYMRED